MPSLPADDFALDQNRVVKSLYGFEDSAKRPSRVPMAIHKGQELVVVDANFPVDSGV
jgi:hypothetical protein